MGIEAAVIHGAAMYRRPGYDPKHVETKVKELFADLELPYDLTGVEILREYLMSLGKDDGILE